MIQSAMMFALGAFLSGLAWLALSVLLVRRARRLTERRLRASISTSRAEFETERDEMRARHAVEMYQREREVSRGLDMATAYRLETDIKERDLVSAMAELQAREEDMQELQQRLTVERDLVQELERKHAEAGTMLRAVQHALTLEVNRRTIAQESLQDANTMADRRRLELSALRAQNEALRAIIGDRMPVDANGAPILTLLPDLSAEAAAVPRVASPAPVAAAAPAPVAAVAPAPAAAEEVNPAIEGGSVVALPTRPRPPARDAAAESAALVAEAARDLHRLAGEAHGDLTNPAWPVPGKAEPPVPLPANGEQAGAHADAQTRLTQALAQIRALKRANQAGE